MDFLGGDQSFQLTKGKNTLMTFPVPHDACLAFTGFPPKVVEALRIQLGVEAYDIVAALVSVHCNMTYEQERHLMTLWFPKKKKTAHLRRVDIALQASFRVNLSDPGRRVMWQNKRLPARDQCTPVFVRGEAITVGKRMRRFRCIKFG